MIEIDIVTPRKGKTHVVASQRGFGGCGVTTLCGREMIAGVKDNSPARLGTTDAFVGDDICKQCAKALPSAQAETEAVLDDLTAALEQSANGEVEDRGDFTQYVATDELTVMAQDMGTYDQPFVRDIKWIKETADLSVLWAKQLYTGDLRHGMVKHARDNRRAKMKKALASL